MEDDRRIDRSVGMNVRFGKRGELIATSDENPLFPETGERESQEPSSFAHVQKGHRTRLLLRRRVAGKMCQSWHPLVSHSCSWDANKRRRRTSVNTFPPPFPSRYLISQAFFSSCLPSRCSCTHPLTPHLTSIKACPTVIRSSFRLSCRWPESEWQT